MKIYKEQITELKVELNRLQAEVTEVQNAIRLLQRKCTHTEPNGKKALVSDHYGKRLNCTICGVIIDEE